MNRRFLVLISSIMALLTGLYVGVDGLLSTITGLTYSIAMESGLREELFVNNKYEVHQRPEKVVNVSLSLTILTVNDLNIKDQTLSVSGYLSINWFDGRLDWSDPSKYSNYKEVDYLFSTEDYVWRPSLVIENSIREMGVINNKHIPMRINQNGGITWNPSGIYEVSCESDTTFYPLDTQQCTIKVSSWAYTSTEVFLQLADNPVILSFYVENGEWMLIEASGRKTNDTSIEGTAFSSVTYNLQLKRRSMFHVINTIIPVTIMAVLISMVYRLPVDCGEKNGFGLTVLLAYAVYLTIISDNIPSTSLSMCYLSLYLLFIFALGAITVLLTTWVIRVHHTGPEVEIPGWVKATFQGKKRPSQVSPYKEKQSMECKEMPVLTWQTVAAKMDVIFFRIYIVLILSITFSIILMYVINYNGY